MKKLYKDDLFLIQFREGDDFLNGKLRHFTARARTGDISEHGTQIGMYVKVVGFYDKKAPLLNWGKTIKSFLRRMNRKGK